MGSRHRRLRQVGGDVEGAAVEARRLSMLLQLYGDDDDVLEPSVEATLRYVAGAVFEAYGDHNNATVAYRNAIALDSTLAFDYDHKRRNDTGTLVVVLEQGFVAHRVEQGLAVLLAPEEVDLIANGDGDERAAGVALVAARALEHATHSAYVHDGPYRPVTFHVPGPEDRSRIPRRKPKVVCTKVESDDGLSAKEECREEKIELDDAPYLLKVAWPAYRHGSRPQQARLIAAGDTIDFLGRADVSDGVIADFRAERGLIVARTIARGAAKLALTKGAENKLEEKNEAAAAILGILGNIGNVLLERADTRSWHLLPAGISIARVDLPAGEHTLVLEAGARTIELPVTVHAGRLTLTSYRIW